MDSSWKNLQIRMEAAWNMRTTPKTKRPKTGDIISSAHSIDWNKKKVRQLQQQCVPHRRKNRQPQKAGASSFAGEDSSRN